MPLMNLVVRHLIESRAFEIPLIVFVKVLSL